MHPLFPIRFSTSINRLAVSLLNCPLLVSSNAVLFTTSPDTVSKFVCWFSMSIILFVDFISFFLGFCRTPMYSDKILHFLHESFLYCGIEFFVFFVNSIGFINCTSESANMLLRELIIVFVEPNPFSPFDILRFFGNSLGINLEVLYIKTFAISSPFFTLTDISFVFNIVSVIWCDAVSSYTLFIRHIPLSTIWFVACNCIM